MEANEGKWFKASVDGAYTAKVGSGGIDVRTKQREAHVVFGATWDHRRGFAPAQVVGWSSNPLDFGLKIQHGSRRQVVDLATFFGSYDPPNESAGYVRRRAPKNGPESSGEHWRLYRRSDGDGHELVVWVANNVRKRMRVPRKYATEEERERFCAAAAAEQRKLYDEGGALFHHPPDDAVDDMLVKVMTRIANVLDRIEERLRPS